MGFSAVNRAFAGILALSLSSLPAFSGSVEILEVTARQSGSTWTFSVTLKHADEGWDHYADLWQVEDTAGTVLGTRVLAHPHVDEQPFTRSLSGVTLPGDLKEVVIRARDSVHGFGSPYRFKMPSEGE